MRVFMFQPPFVPLILKGIKTSTIRPTPKREVEPGTLLSLRQWQDKPYRSKQLIFATKTLRQALPVVIDAFDVYIDGEKLSHSELAALAKHEGFTSYDAIEDLFNWFSSHYKLPFHGIIYHWD